MALKDQIPLGMCLPHRSPDPIDVPVIRQVAQRAEALGFRDLWVTENTLDHASCLDALTLLTYAAALTTTIRLGVSVLVLPVHSPLQVAHRVATLDYLSGGRAVLGVGLGRDYHYEQFQIPRARRVRRSLESVELIKALWTEPSVTYQGQIFSAREWRDGAQTGTTTAPSDMVGRWTPRRAQTGGEHERWVDGRRRLGHRRF